MPRPPSRPTRTVVSLLALAVAVTTMACSGEQPAAAPETTTTTAAPTTTVGSVPGEQIYVFDLGAGECFDQRVTRGQGQVDVETLFRVPCSGPHDNEVFLVARMPQDVTAPWPGEEAVATFADERCGAAVEGFVGLPYELSAYEVGYLVPTAATWFTPDRDVVCFVFHYQNQKLVGSARDTRLCASEFEGSDARCDAYASQAPG